MPQSSGIVEFLESTVQGKELPLCPVPRTPEIGRPFASDQSHLDEVITGGFYSIGAEVLVEQETANYFKAATVLQMCCGEVRVEYLSGKKEWVV